MWLCVCTCLADKEALCQGVGRGWKSHTTSRENREWPQCHQTRCRKSKHTRFLSKTRHRFFFFFFSPLVFKMSISFLTVWVSLFFVAVCAPVCLISFFASVPAHLPICILFCIVHPFIFYSLSPLSRCLSPALKAKQHAHSRTHTAEECRNDYAAELQKYNKEQNFFYYTEIPQIFNVRPTQMHTFPMQ